MTLCLLACTLAHADTLEATLSQPLRELSHDVKISVDKGVATYRVQRVFANRGDTADEASLDIDLPFGAGVTGLRIRARDTWYDGDLMEAKAAAALYEKLTGFGPFPAKDPALLQWVWPDKVHLQVFPVLPGQTSTVEYTLTVPTQYRNGRQHLSYPRFNGGQLAGPAFSVEGKRITYDGQATPPKWKPEEPKSVFAGGVDPLPGASYVFQALEIADVARARGEIKSASLDLDLSHTYRGDLRVQLVTPQGKVVTIHDRDGGSKNDVRGQFPLQLPPGTSAHGKWRLVISDHAARDVGTLNRWTLNFDLGHALSATKSEPLFIPDAPEGADDHGLTAIELDAPPIETLDARLGRVVASPKHGFLRLELDAAPQLRPLPKNAQVVFVIDASYSEGEEGIAAQLQIARAYLKHVPDAEFEIVCVRRFASRLNDFAKAERFDEIAKKIEPGNGSAIELGLLRALDDLRARSGEKRVVLLSDAELRSAFSVKRALSSLSVPKDVIVHLVVTDGRASDDPTEQRDDQHELSPIAEAGHGVLYQFDGARTDLAKLTPVALVLVRPIRIDHFSAPGFTVPEALDEGVGFREMLELANPSQRVTLKGKIWAEPFTRTVDTTPAFDKATAAFVFSEHRYTELEEREQMAVAMKGQVVSPVTSYIAIEPGTRPSRIGLRHTSGMGFGGGSGRGAGGISSHYPAKPIRPDVKAMLSPAYEACVKQHGVHSAALDIETTVDEIVDVITPDQTPFASCMVEAAWNLRLPPISRQFARDHFALKF
jgi:hypothetical protein